MRVALKFFVVGLAFAHALALAPVSDEIKQAFGRFKVQYNKTYKDSMDEARRFKNFVSVYNFVAAYNKRFENGEVQSDVTINRFADMFPAELRTISTGTIKPPYEFSNFTVRPKEVVTVTSSMVPPGPASIDWLKLGHVTPVKDQGYTCNSCWAFSVRLKSTRKLANQFSFTSGSSCFGVSAFNVSSLLRGSKVWFPIATHPQKIRQTLKSFWAEPHWLQQKLSNWQLWVQGWQSSCSLHVHSIPTRNRKRGLLSLWGSTSSFRST